MERIAIFAALQWECRTVLRHLRQIERGRQGAFTCWRGRAARAEVWVVKMGVGMQRAAAAAQAIGDPRGFALLMSTGCAGGLAPELDPGDLALATAVVGDGAGAGAQPTDATQRARALRATRAAGLRAIEGPMACSPTALLTVAEKRAAAAAGAIAVDMEGGAIAAHAASMQVPFLSVRAVLDGAEHELPAAATFIDPASGGVRPLALAGHIAAHPSVIGELIALQRMQHAARTSLERFFEQWLAAPDGGDD